jgi:hypothetical protein
MRASLDRQSEHGADSEHYRMLRQAMLARRTLLLLDGLDEGGQVRAQIEKHVTEVLAPQGFVMLVTSRPGINAVARTNPGLAAWCWC